VSALLLQAARGANQDLLEFGGVIDEALRIGSIHCQSEVESYDAVTSAPRFDVPGSDPVTQRAYEYYENALCIFTDGARDLTLHCSSFLRGESENKPLIPPQEWALARQRTNEAAELLNQAIRWLEQR
jgi:hypothetical protein